MDRILEYAQRSSPDHGLKRAAYVTAITAVICFALPFLLFYLKILANPGNGEAAFFNVILYTVLLWGLSGVLGLVGILAGAYAWASGDRRVSILIAIAISCMPPGIIVLLFMVRWLHS
jgi:hypothetical protein